MNRVDLKQESCSLWKIKRIRVFRHSVRLGYLSYDHERIVSGCEPIVIISAQFVGLSQLHVMVFTPGRTEADMSHPHHQESGAGCGKIVTGGEIFK